MGEQTAQKRDLLLVHVTITLLLIIGFGYLPPFGSITPIGMRLLGIFFGVVYAWTTTTLIWPSLLGIVAVGMSGLMPLPEFFKITIGNETVLFILFTFILLGVFEEAGLVNYMANWFVSRKIVFGRPWLFTFVFLFGAFICGMLVNEIASTLIFWGIYYSLAKRFGFQPHDKYSTLMMFAIAFCACTAASTTFPFKMGPLIWLSAYTQLTGESVNFFQYTLFAIPMASMLVVLLVLIMRFIFRPDISALKNICDDIVEKEALILNKKQKIAFGFLLAMIILLLAPDFLPAQLFITIKLKALTKAGTLMLLIVALFFIKVDSKPMMNFSEMTRYISWDMVFMFALILPLSNLMTADATGIKPFLIDLLTPLLAGHSSLMFAFIVLFSCFLLTNISNNGVLGVIYISLIIPLTDSMGIEPFPIIAVMVFVIQLAYLTPAGSAPAAILFGNGKWVRAKDLYQYIIISLLIIFIVVFIVGMPLAQIIFS